MKMLDWLKIKINSRDERGITLTEAAVAVFLLGGVVLTLVMSMSSGIVAVGSDDSLVTAQGLARTQMEYIKNCSYNATADTYPAVAAPPGYTVTVNVAGLPDTNNNIQKITAAVTRGGNTLFTLEDYKVNR